MLSGPSAENIFLEFYSSKRNPKVLIHNDQEWTGYVGGTFPAYFHGPLSDLEIVLFDGLDVRPFRGAQVYAGFGANAKNMPGEDKYRLLYLVP